MTTIIIYCSQLNRATEILSLVVVSILILGAFTLFNLTIIYNFEILEREIIITITMLSHNWQHVYLYVFMRFYVQPRVWV